MLFIPVHKQVHPLKLNVSYNKDAYLFDNYALIRLTAKTGMCVQNFSKIPDCNVLDSFKISS